MGVNRETINNALPYLEARHRFIHADGKADDKFKADYPGGELDADDYIKLNATIVQKAIVASKKMLLNMRQ